MQFCSAHKQGLFTMSACIECCSNDGGNYPASASCVAVTGIVKHDIIPHNFLVLLAADIVAGMSMH